MARLRFPGRPGHRFDRLSVKYFAEDVKNISDPSLAFLPQFRAGLRVFRQLVGESDEDDDFDGFTQDDVSTAETKLRILEKENQKVVETSPETSPTIMDSGVTRLGRGRQLLDSLPASERTRGRIKAIVRKSYKAMIKEGLASPTKTHKVAKFSDIVSPPLEKKKTEKIVKPPKAKPTKFKLDYKHDIYKGPTKKADSDLAKFLLEKAKQLQQIQVEKRTKSPPKAPAQRRQFILPSQSSRSSRTIKPNKRFLEEDSFQSVVKKKPKPEKKAASVQIQTQIDEKVVPNEKAIKSTQSPVVASPNSRSVGLLDQPLIVDGKRERKPSLKIQLKSDHFGYIDDDNDEIVDLTGSPTRCITSPLAAPKLGTSFIPQTGTQTKFQKASEGQRLGMMKFGSSRMQGASIVQKAKLQLNRAALNKSKAALARSLKAEMKLEATFQAQHEQELVSPTSSAAGTVKKSLPNKCEVCGGDNIDKTFRAIVQCVPCMRFYYRKVRGIEKMPVPCIGPKKGRCTITPENRADCRFCRIKKMAAVGLPIPETLQLYLESQNKPPPVKSPVGATKRLKSPVSIPKCLKSPVNAAERLKSPETAKAHVGKSRVLPDSHTIVSLPVPGVRVDFIPTPASGETTQANQLSPLMTVTGSHEKKMKKRRAFKELLKTKQEKAEDMDSSILASPEPVVHMEPPSETSSPGAGSRGPRIKHVCRNAAVVLGRAPARFAEKAEFRLSALPTQEKVQLWKDEQTKAADSDSDDGRPIEEIIQQSIHHNRVITIKKSPHKTKKQPAGNEFRLYKRKIRCKRCAGCLAKECEKCVYCLDKKKFGGQQILKQGCINRKCLNPMLRQSAPGSFINPVLRKPIGRPSKASPKKPETTAETRDTAADNILSEADDIISEADDMDNNNLPPNKIVPITSDLLGEKLVEDPTIQQLVEDPTIQPIVPQPPAVKVQVPGAEVRRLAFDPVPSNTEGEPHRLAFSRKNQSGKMNSKVNLKKNIKEKYAKPNGNADGQFYPVTLQSVVPLSRQWGSSLIRPLIHKVKVDFQSSCDLNDVWLRGLALTISGQLCVRTVCFLCGSAGKHDLIYCNICCEPFHEFCLEEDELPTTDCHLNDWCCPRCQFCHVCGRRNNLLRCDKCQNTYHPECLGPNYPTKPSKKKQIWMCAKCVKCKSCGATTPGVSCHATWTYDFSLCFECGKLMDKGNFCPICHRCYSDDDWESKMIQCNTCESWVHSKCEGLTDEMYEILSFLPEDLSFNCRKCYPVGCPEWESTLRRELRQGIENLLQTLFSWKNSQHIQRIEKKHSPMKLSILPADPATTKDVEQSKSNDCQIVSIETNNAAITHICKDNDPKSARTSDKHVKECDPNTGDNQPCDRTAKDTGHDKMDVDEVTTAGQPVLSSTTCEDLSGKAGAISSKNNLCATTDISDDTRTMSGDSKMDISDLNKVNLALPEAISPGPSSRSAIPKCDSQSSVDTSTKVPDISASSDPTVTVTGSGDCRTRNSGDCTINLFSTIEQGPGSSGDCRHCVTPGNCGHSESKPGNSQSAGENDLHGPSAGQCGLGAAVSGECDSGDSGCHRDVHHCDSIKTTGCCTADEPIKAVVNIGDKTGSNTGVICAGSGADGLKTHCGEAVSSKQCCDGATSCSSDPASHCDTDSGMESTVFADDQTGNTPLQKSKGCDSVGKGFGEPQQCSSNSSSECSASELQTASTPIEACGKLASCDPSQPQCETSLFKSSCDNDCQSEVVKMETDQSNFTENSHQSEGTKLETDQLEAGLLSNQSQDIKIDQSNVGEMSSQSAEGNIKQCGKSGGTVPMKISSNNDLNTDFIKNEESKLQIKNEMSIDEELRLINSSVADQGKPTVTATKSERSDKNTQMCSAKKSPPKDNTKNKDIKHVKPKHETVKGSELAVHKSSRVHFSMNEDNSGRSNLEESGRSTPASDQYPQDLIEVREKMNSNGYDSVASFCEDIVRIIQAYLDDDSEKRVTRKKAVISTRTIFVKQLERVFPWYNVKQCHYWFSNKKLPHGMLPDATLPPSDDHTYAQWLERAQLPMSPQPSPFKSTATPVKKLFAIGDDGEVQTFMEGEDNRRCLLCLQYGDQDGNDAGRLLYCGQNDWVHVNCALWSAEVYEDTNGKLQNLIEAYSRGKFLKCNYCDKCGATVGCNTKGCPANYHFMCGRRDRCLFQEDKKVFCKRHSSMVDGALLHHERFSVVRRVVVGHINIRKGEKRTWNKGLNADIVSILIGSCTIESLGRLTDLSDNMKLLTPVDYTCTRVYWSTKDARRRCVYTCRVMEVLPESLKSPTIPIKDMRIIHDVNHPDYVPLPELDLSRVSQDNTKQASESTLSASEVVDLTHGEFSNTSDVIQLMDTTEGGAKAQESRISSSFGGMSSTQAASVDCEILSQSWPLAKPKETKSNKEYKLDLGLLSPKTMKLLNLKDPSKYTKPAVSAEADDDFHLLKIADRLNRAAAKSSRKSEERTMPQPLSTSSRSPSVGRGQQYSPSTIMNSSHSPSVEKDLPASSFSPAVRMRSKSPSPLTYARPYSPPLILSKVIGNNQEQAKHQNSVKPTTIEGQTKNNSLSLLSPEPVPVSFSSPIQKPTAVASTSMDELQTDEDCLITGVSSLASVSTPLAVSVSSTFGASKTYDSITTLENLSASYTLTESSCTETGMEIGNEPDNPLDNSSVEQSKTVTTSCTETSLESYDVNKTTMENSTKTIIAISEDDENLNEEEDILLAKTVINQNGIKINKFTKLELESKTETNTESCKDPENERSDSPFIPQPVSEETECVGIIKSKLNDNEIADDIDDEIVSEAQSTVADVQVRVISGSLGEERELISVAADVESDSDSDMEIFDITESVLDHCESGSESETKFTDNQYDDKTSMSETCADYDSLDSDIELLDINIESTLTSDVEEDTIRSVATIISDDEHSKHVEASSENLPERCAARHDEPVSSLKMPSNEVSAVTKTLELPGNDLKRDNNLQTGTSDKYNSETEKNVSELNTTNTVGNSVCRMLNEDTIAINEAGSAIMVSSSEGEIDAESENIEKCVATELTSQEESQTDISTDNESQYHSDISSHNELLSKDETDGEYSKVGVHGEFELHDTSAFKPVVKRVQQVAVCVTDPIVISDNTDTNSGTESEICLSPNADVDQKIGEFLKEQATREMTSSFDIQLESDSTSQDLETDSELDTENDTTIVGTTDDEMSKQADSAEILNEDDVYVISDTADSEDESDLDENDLLNETEFENCIESAFEALVDGDSNDSTNVIMEQLQAGDDKSFGEHVFVLNPKKKVFSNFGDHKSPKSESEVSDEIIIDHVDCHSESERVFVMKAKEKMDTTENQSDDSSHSKIDITITEESSECSGESNVDNVMKFSGNVPTDKSVKTSDIRSENEKQEVLRGLGLGRSEDIEKEKKSPSNSPLKLPPIPEKCRERKKLYLLTPTKTYPLRRHTVSPARYRAEGDMQLLEPLPTRKDRKISHLAETNSSKLPNNGKRSKEDYEKSAEKYELPVLDPVAKKIKLESLSKSSAGDKGPFKCPKCRRMYRTENSFSVHVNGCDFYVSSSEDDDDNGDSNLGDPLDTISVSSDDSNIDGDNFHAKGSSKKKGSYNASGAEPKSKEDKIPTDDVSSDSQSESENEEPKPRSSLRKSTVVQRVAFEAEKRMREEATQSTESSQRKLGQPGLNSPTVQIERLKLTGAIQPKLQNKFELEGFSPPRHSYRRRTRSEAVDDRQSFVDKSDEPLAKRGRGRPRKEPKDDVPLGKSSPQTSNNLIKSRKDLEDILQFRSSKRKTCEDTSSPVTELFAGRNKRGQPGNDSEDSASTDSQATVESVSSKTLVKRRGRPPKIETDSSYTEDNCEFVMDSMNTNELKERAKQIQDLVESERNSRRRKRETTKSLEELETSASKICTIKRQFSEGASGRNTTNKSTYNYGKTKLNEAIDDSDVSCGGSVEQDCIPVATSCDIEQVDNDISGNSESNNEESVLDESSGMMIYKKKGLVISPSGKDRTSEYSNPSTLEKVAASNIEIETAVDSDTKKGYPSNKPEICSENTMVDNQRFKIDLVCNEEIEDDEVDDGKRDKVCLTNSKGHLECNSEIGCDKLAPANMHTDCLNPDIGSDNNVQLNENTTHLNKDNPEPIELKDKDATLCLENNPSNLIDNPGHLKDDPNHLKNLSEHLISTLSHSEDTTGTVKDNPGHVTDNPGHSVGNAGHFKDNPGHHTDNHSHLNDNVDGLKDHLTNDQCHLKDNPGQLKDNSGHSKDNLGHSTDNPGYLKDNHGHHAYNPGHLKDNPGHLTNNPGHLKDNPGHSTGNPGHLKDNPGHSTGNPGPNPGHLKDNPGHSTGNPLHLKNNPGHTTGNPGHLKDNPGHPTGNPGHLKDNPGHTTGNPGHLKDNPGHSTGNPGHLKDNPGHSTGNPGHLKDNPGHTTSNPGHLKDNPGHSTGNPGHLKGNPGHLKDNPGHSTGNPGHLKDNPGKLNDSPAQLTSKSGRLKTYPDYLKDDFGFSNLNQKDDVTFNNSVLSKHDHECNKQYSGQVKNKPEVLGSLVNMTSVKNRELDKKDKVEIGETISKLPERVPKYHTGANEKSAEVPLSNLPHTVVRLLKDGHKVIIKNPRLNKSYIWEKTEKGYVGKPFNKQLKEKPPPEHILNAFKGQDIHKSDGSTSRLKSMDNRNNVESSKSVLGAEPITKIVDKPIQKLDDKSIKKVGISVRPEPGTPGFHNTFNTDDITYKRSFLPEGAKQIKTVPPMSTTARITGDTVPEYTSASSASASDILAQRKKTLAAKIMAKEAGGHIGKLIETNANRIKNAKEFDQIITLSAGQKVKPVQRNTDANAVTPPAPKITVAKNTVIKRSPIAMLPTGVPKLAPKTDKTAAQGMSASYIGSIHLGTPSMPVTIAAQSSASYVGSIHLSPPSLSVTMAAQTFQTSVTMATVVPRSAIQPAQSFTNVGIPYTVHNLQQIPPVQPQVLQLVGTQPVPGTFALPTVPVQTGFQTFPQAQEPTFNASILSTACLQNINQPQGPAIINASLIPAQTLLQQTTAQIMQAQAPIVNLQNLVKQMQSNLTIETQSQLHGEQLNAQLNSQQPVLSTQRYSLLQHSEQINKQLNMQLNNQQSALNTQRYSMVQTSEQLSSQLSTQLSSQKLGPNTQKYSLVQPSGQLNTQSSTPSTGQQMTIHKQKYSLVQSSGQINTQSSTQSTSQQSTLNTPQYSLVQRGTHSNSQQSQSVHSYSLPRATLLQAKQQTKPESVQIQPRPLQSIMPVSEIRLKPPQQSSTQVSIAKSVAVTKSNNISPEIRSAVLGKIMTREMPSMASTRREMPSQESMAARSYESILPTQSTEGRNTPVSSQGDASKTLDPGAQLALMAKSKTVMNIQDFAHMLQKMQSSAAASDTPVPSIHIVTADKSSVLESSTMVQLTNDSSKSVQQNSLKTSGNEHLGIDKFRQLMAKNIARPNVPLKIYRPKEPIVLNQKVISPIKNTFLQKDSTVLGPQGAQSHISSISRQQIEKHMFARKVHTIGIGTTLSPAKKRAKLVGKDGPRKYRKKENGEPGIKRGRPKGVKSKPGKNYNQPHVLGHGSHPIIHPQKDVTSLPAAAVEEEVHEIPLNKFIEQMDSRRTDGHEHCQKKLGNLVYEIVGDDGFKCRSDTIDGVWRQVMEKVQDVRTASRLKELSYGGVNGTSMYGLNHNNVVYLLEQLHGANYCRRYKFKYHKHELVRKEVEYVNPTGCIRTEPFCGRKPYDIFSFLMSRYRRKPVYDQKTNDQEMILKSARRATSLDLPMAMRFRKLREHAREAVGVYRSNIHGRGLYCKRSIDAGEMVIEYSGEVIRECLTDFREKYYESKGIGCYMFRIDDTDVVDATLKGSAARFINHSCEPNCYSKVITVDNRKHIVIFAIRGVQAGEELTYDYKFPFEEVKILCSCGSRKCRKYLN